MVGKCTTVAVYVHTGIGIRGALGYNKKKLHPEILEVVTRSAQSLKKVIAFCHIHGVTSKILSRLHDQKHFLHLPSMLTVV